MLIIRRHHTIPATRVLEDLALRIGPATENSPTSLEGLYTEVTQPQLRGTVNGIQLLQKTSGLEYIMRQNKDIDLKWCETKMNQFHPHAKVEVNRIEDVSEDQIKYAVQDLIVSIKMNAEKSMSSYERNISQRKILDMSEDGDEEYLSPNELLTESDTSTEVEVDADSISSLRERAAYLIKMIHEKSKEWRFHMMSYLIAYDKYKDRMQNSDVGQIGSIKPRDFYGTTDHPSENRFYKMEPTGKLGVRLTRNTHAGKEGPAWISGETSVLLTGNMTDQNRIRREKELYLEYGLELIAICEMLGYPLRKEEPEDYNEERVERIVITYIADNRKYIESIRTFAHEATYNSIRNIDINTYGMAEVKERTRSVDSVTITDRCINTGEIYMRAEHTHKHLRLGEYGLFRLFMETYNELHGTAHSGNVDDWDKLNGFYISTSDKYLVLSLDGMHKESASHPKAILHQSGTLVRLIENISVLVTADISEANRYLRKLMRTRVETGHPTIMPKENMKWNTVMV